MNNFKEIDKGIWSLFLTTDGRLGVISSDFHRDVVLYINGDFETPTEKLKYAESLVEFLNKGEQC